MEQETAAERASNVVLGLLETIHEHKDGTLAGEDPEQLHDMRVATRRLRTALRVMQDALPEALLALSEDFRWLGGVLGTVRDLDVQIDSLRAEVDEGKAEAGAMAPIIAVLEERRRTARQSLIAGLTGERYGDLILAATKALAWPESRPDGEQGEGEFASRVSQARYRSLRKAARRLEAESDDAAYHEVRKRARRLRYTLEFLYPDDWTPTRRMIARLVEVQDLLGEHQDGAVSSALLREISLAAENEMPREALLLAGKLIERRQAHAREIRKEAPAALKGVRQAWKRMRSKRRKG